MYTIAKGVETMKVNITARNTGIKDSFRARVEKKLAKFDKFFGDSAQAQVTVIHSGDHETVEVTIKSEGLSSVPKERLMNAKMLWKPSLTLFRHSDCQKQIC